MGKLKRIAADDWFSKCIRERANWTCEICKTEYPDAQAKGASMSLDCSHLFGRSNWSVRFNVHNAFCHCYGCHSRFGGDRELQRKHFNEVFGEGLYEILQEQKNDSKIGRVVRKSVREISKHYREEFRRMRELRKEGQQGRIEITNWW